MSDLNDFLKLVAEGKKNTPSGRVKKIEEEVKTNVKSDLSSLFAQLAEVKTPQERLAAGEPVPISELPEIQAEIAQAIQDGTVDIQGELNEVALPTPIGKVPETAQLPDIDKYLKTKSVTTQPDEPYTNQFKQVNDKLKFLERWVTQIQNAGPGSGEVNFRYLDDVNRLTMSPSNDNWVLEYDVATKKVQFTENIGPIRTLRFNTLGPSSPLVPGQAGWNVEEDCLDIAQADGSTLQVGLEHYIQIHNSTGETLYNGEVVMFAGVDEESHTNPMPTIQRYVADATATPLYIIGVMTNDVPTGGHGRATVFGKIHNFNTTGSAVGETWAKGDLLWAHPSMPGKMTKVRPTAPNVSTSIAAVLQVSATEGILLVRPTIWPRLFFGDWYSTQTQTHTAIHTPKRITVNNSGFVSGFTNNNGLITAQNAGLYNFQFSLQLTSSNSSTQYYWIWYRKNGQDVPNSATKLSISSNSIILAPSWNFPVHMVIGDTFELMWAADGLNVSITNIPATAFCPACPSVILTVQQTNL